MKLIVSSVVLGLAWFAVINLLLSGAAWLVARLALRTRTPNGTRVLLGIRLLPSLAASFVVVLVFLPAHLRFEPAATEESLGMLLPFLALVSSAVLLRSFHRAITVARASASLRHITSGAVDGISDAYEVEHLPGVSIAGVFHTRILVGAAVRSLLSDAEFEVAVAHEVAHRTFHDNLKRCAMFCAPDFFGWSDVSRRLEERWRAEAECRADAAAVGDDRARALHLASALIKVARLAGPGPSSSQSPVWSTFHEPRLFETRVRRLVSGNPAPQTRRHAGAGGMLLVAVPLSIWTFGAPYHLHRLTELLVAVLP